MGAHIIEALQQAIPSDPVTLSATLIHTAGRDAVAKDLCINTLKKYIANVAKGEKQVPLGLLVRANGARWSIRTRGVRRLSIFHVFV